MEIVSDKERFLSRPYKTKIATDSSSFYQPENPPRVLPKTGSRYECEGKLRVGTELLVRKVGNRWTRFAPFRIEAFKQLGEEIPFTYYKAVITLRYFTVNRGYRNYHARVKIMEGPFEGREISIRC
jgi:hypothetical protein